MCGWRLLFGGVSAVRSLALNNAHALRRPKGSRVKRYGPSAVMNATQLRLSSWRGSCKYPCARSKHEKKQLPCKRSSTSLTKGRGEVSSVVASFKGRGSIQMRYVRSFFKTTRSGLRTRSGAVGSAGSMMPASSHAWTWARIASCSGGAYRRLILLTIRTSFRSEERREIGGIFAGVLISWMPLRAKTARCS